MNFHVKTFEGDFCSSLYFQQINISCHTTRVVATGKIFNPSIHFKADTKFQSKVVVRFIQMLFIIVSYKSL